MTESNNSVESEMTLRPEVTFTNDTINKKVDVKIDGESFTSYVYDGQTPKPILYPIITKSGKTVTRGFPFAPRPSERVDHPHHVGLWMNYGDVNGLDFWNNSYAIPAEEKHNFSQEGNTRIIDRIATLKAIQEVSLKDNKEGMIAMRMTRELELPSDKPAEYTDADGNVTEVKVLNNEGINGNYYASEGLTGGDVWATRNKWMKLEGSMEAETVSVTIIDHEKNVGYPTYWHARGENIDPEMTSIFDGDDLDAWEVPENNVWWFMDEGTLWAKSDPDKTGSILWTKKKYKDFIVQMDFKFGEGTVDSGIFMRGDDELNAQIQIGESGSLKRDMTASPYVPKQGYPVEATRVKELLKMNNWNTIKATGR
ncbi:hypothetical protein GQR58_028932 [Nymphon striatum]|nr:hypothetical protein GQR58_028932 [Nymphon striatum]